MTGQELKRYRGQNRLTQVQAAKRLGVSQTYLSLLEAGQRRLTRELKRKLVTNLEISPTKLPSLAEQFKVAKASDNQLTADLSALGYPGFSHHKPSRPKNPADVLLSALQADNRDARLMEALPWLVLVFTDMNWNALSRTAKVYDLQNRLGFVVSVARGLSEARGIEKADIRKLKTVEAELESSMLAREDTLCHDAMTSAERRWLASHRSDEARHWRILASLSPQLVRYAN